jgi:hypothetical protein
MCDESYSNLLEIQNSRYQNLQKLITSWLEDPSDHDTHSWPDIKHTIQDSKIQFREDF